MHSYGGGRERQMNKRGLLRNKRMFDLHCTRHRNGKWPKTWCARFLKGRDIVIL